MKRIYQVFKFTNGLTIKNTYLVPNIQIILDKIWESKYFIVLNIWLEYNNIYIQKQDW